MKSPTWGLSPQKYSPLKNSSQKSHQHHVDQHHFQHAAPSVHKSRLHAAQSSSISLDSLLMNPEPLSAFSTDPLIVENTLLVKKLHVYKQFVSIISHYYPRELNDVIVRYLNEDLEGSDLERNVHAYYAKTQQQKQQGVMKKTENRLRRRITSLEADVVNLKERNRVLKERLSEFGEILPPSSLGSRDSVQTRGFPPANGTIGDSTDSLNQKMMAQNAPIPLSSGMKSTIDVINANPHQHRFQKLETKVLEYEVLYSNLMKEVDELRKINAALKDMVAQKDSRMHRVKQKSKEITDKLREERHSRHADKKLFEQQIKSLKDTLPAMNNEHTELGISTSLDFEYNALSRIAAQPLPIDQHNHFMSVRTDFPTLNTGRTEALSGRGRRSLSPFASRSPSSARTTQSMGNELGEGDSPVEKMKRMIQETTKSLSVSLQSSPGETSNKNASLSSRTDQTNDRISTSSPQIHDNNTFLRVRHSSSSDVPTQSTQISRKSTDTERESHQPGRGPRRLNGGSPLRSLQSIHSRPISTKSSTNLTPIQQHFEISAPHNGFLGSLSRQKRTQHFIHSIVNENADDLLRHRRSTVDNKPRRR
mmetsp:Transcript_7748/g.29033  ORF Transcript_7748/g.29033 Transcript_7748/m.29033 type:complete len:592 (-) Transcript_7748:743-2518(-)